MRFRNLFFIALLCCVLLLAGCDIAEQFSGGADGSDSSAVQVIESVQPLVPNGIPRLLLDIALLGAAYLSRRGSKKELAANEAREYNTEEAQSMLAAIALHKAELEKDAEDATGVQ